MVTLLVTGLASVEMRVRYNGVNISPVILCKVPIVESAGTQSPRFRRRTGLDYLEY